VAEGRSSDSLLLERISPPAHVLAPGAMAHKILVGEPGSLTQLREEFTNKCAPFLPNSRVEQREESNVEILVEMIQKTHPKKDMVPAPVSFGWRVSPQKSETS